MHSGKKKGRERTPPKPEAVTFLAIACTPLYIFLPFVLTVFALKKKKKKKRKEKFLYFQIGEKESHSFTIFL